MADGMRWEYVSWNRFYDLCSDLHRRIVADDFRPEVIVAVARGGYMPGRVLADFFGQMALTAIRIEHYRGLERRPETIIRDPLTTDIRGRRVLLVDDVSDSGDTFSVALDHLHEKGPPLELRTAALHHKQSSSYTPDFYARRVVKWRWIIYPWAVVEDVSALLEGMSPRPRALDVAERGLRESHGLALPRTVMRQVADKLGLSD